VFIWAKILALDTSCQADLVKDGGHLYFLKYLDAPEPGIDHHSRAQVVGVAASAGLADHWALLLLQLLLLLRSAVSALATPPPNSSPPLALPAHTTTPKAVFVLATVCDGHPRGQALCYQANLLGSLLRWLQLLLPGLAALEAQQVAASAGAVGGGGGSAPPGVDPGVSRGAALLVKWCCLALGKMVEDAPEAAAVSDEERR